MNQVSNSRRPPGRRATVMLLVPVLLAACTESDRTGPSTESQDLATPQAAAAVAPSGIMFASFGLTPSQLSTVHTGIVKGNNPSELLSYLSQVRAKGGRVLVKLAGGDQQYRNPDNTFNLGKWKAQLDRYRNINFSSYIADGTIVAHYLIDEPHFPSRWGNHTIPQSTVEEAARYSKQLWPNMPTVVNAPANWLASASVTYTGLDAGWAMYRASGSSSPTTWVASQVKKAKSKGLGLFAGLNVLDGGDGSSGFRGNLPKRWAMSAGEVRSYGIALLSQSYVCGFAMWTYKASYYDRADVKSAMADVSAKARSHAKTSCKQ